MVVTVIVVAGAVGLVTLLTGDDEPAEEAEIAPPVTQPTAEPDVEVEATEPEPIGSEDEPADEPSATEPPTDSDDDSIAGAPSGERGDRSNPVPAGAIADLGDGWRLQVLDVIHDATTLVFEENQFNDPPPDGARFTLVTVALGYFGTNDPSAAPVSSISAIGSADTELSWRCGVIPDALPSFNSFFAGGVLTGNLCFVTDPDDAEWLQLSAVARFGVEQVFLEASVAPTAVEVLSPIRGINAGAAATEARRSPTPIGEAADMGDDWTFQVTSPAVDITDAVAAENMFNAPPPEGFRFIGVEVEYSYRGVGAASPSWVFVKAVGDSNVELVGSCGVTPDSVDLFTDVVAGGSTSGTLCFVVPDDDIGSLVLYGSADVRHDTQFFATR